ncbi:hypothetical protein ILYODFUR_037999 [Ilyodon furcidens]|uniref:Uncharacterized protein n=1 Tax=Ilyodon furcidens TaxID=33524 RepID=A0ABV0VKP8_9TELE
MICESALALRNSISLRDGCLMRTNHYKSLISHVILLALNQQVCKVKGMFLDLRYASESSQNTRHHAHHNNQVRVEAQKPFDADTFVLQYTKRYLILLGFRILHMFLNYKTILLFVKLFSHRKPSHCMKTKTPPSILKVVL